MIPNTKFVFKESFKATRKIILAHIIEYIKWFYMPQNGKSLHFVDKFHVAIGVFSGQMIGMKLVMSFCIIQKRATLKPCWSFLG